MSIFYQSAKTLFLKAGLNLLTDDIRVCLVTTGSGGYAYNAATNQFLSDVPAAGRVATSGSLTTKTVANAVFDADDVTFPNLASSNNVNAAVVFKSTGTDSTSPLIAYLDYGNNLPFVPDGNNLKLIWNTSGIFGFY